MNAAEIFGAPLSPDPSIALPKFVLPEDLLRPAPLHKMHYVVEIVGPRTVPASQVLPLLDKAWQDPLGRPTVYVMAPADAAWRPLASGDPAQSFDSLALAWPYVAPAGSLSRHSAEQLLASTERYATQVGRRALPVPLPEDAAKTARILVQARDNLDIGVTILILPGESARAISERDVWIACAALGLDYVSPGTFRWLASLSDGVNSPASVAQRQLLEVAPFEDAELFSLGGAQSCRAHNGISVGFSAPLSPDPTASARAALAVASLFRSRYGCIALYDASRPIDAAWGSRLLAEMNRARDALLSAGIRPGSSEALALFSS